MKVLVFSTHKIDDDRIKRHVKYIVNNNMDVYYLHYNLRENELPRGHFSLAGEKGYRFNFKPGRVLVRKCMLLMQKVVNDTIDTLKELGVASNDQVVIHVHNPELFMVIKGLLKKYMDNAVVVYDRHEYYERQKGFFGFKSLLAMERLGRNIIDSIILVSEGQREFVRKFFKTNYISIVPNFPDTSEYDINRIKRKIRSVKNGEPVRLAYIGTFNNRDNELLLHISETLFERCSGVHVTIAGLAGKNLRKKLKEYQDKYGTSRLSYLGPITRKETIEITENAHIGFQLLSPEIEYRTSPNKVYEYLCCGVVPIVKANIDYYDRISHFAIQLNNGITLKDNLEIIIDMINDRQKLQDYMMRALDSSTYFSWENVACNYVDIYNNALPGLYVNDR